MKLRSRSLVALSALLFATTACSDESLPTGLSSSDVEAPSFSTAGVATAVDDYGSISINSTLLGNTGSYFARRSYTIPASAYQAGSNEFRLTTMNTGGPEGFYYEGNVTFECSPGYGYAAPACVVTYATVCAYVREVVTDTEVAQGLCDKLAAMEGAAGRGNARAKEGPRGAFQNQVRAQVGKSIAVADAERLLALVAQL